jgi:hypothetical protein
MRNQWILVTGTRMASAATPAQDSPTFQQPVVCHTIPSVPVLDDYLLSIISDLFICKVKIAKGSLVFVHCLMFADQSEWEI